MSAAGRTIAAGCLLLLGAVGAMAAHPGGVQRSYVEASDPRLSRSGRRWLFQGAPLSATLVEAQPGGGAAYLPVADGYLNGIARVDYPDGAPRSRRGYLAGKKQGAQLEYWPNGNKKLEETMSGDRAVGLSRAWRPDGTLAAEHRYFDGHEEGLQRAWSARGELEANYVVRGGRRYGYFNSAPCTEAAELAEAR